MAGSGTALAFVLRLTVTARNVIVVAAFERDVLSAIIAVASRGRFAPRSSSRLGTATLPAPGPVTGA